MRSSKINLKINCLTKYFNTIFPTTIMAFCSFLVNLCIKKHFSYILNLHLIVVNLFFTPHLWSLWSCYILCRLEPKKRKEEKTKAPFFFSCQKSRSSAVIFFSSNHTFTMSLESSIELFIERLEHRRFAQSINPT
jgi:hypothetical protein